MMSTRTPKQAALGSVVRRALAPLVPHARADIPCEHERLGGQGFLPYSVRKLELIPGLDRLLREREHFVSRCEQIVDLLPQ